MPNKNLVGVFDSDEKMIRAAQKAKESSLPAFDAYTPFPIHGIDEVLALKPSFLPKVCFVGGATGLLTAFSLQYWVHAVYWPMNIGGKSFTAYPAMVPICFELTVLFAGVSTFFGFLFSRGMHPFKTSPFWGLQTENDKFALVFELDSEEKAERISRLLNQEGALEIREINA